MNKSQMLKALKSKFNLPVKDASEFYGESSSSIWCAGDICRPETDYYDYAEGTWDDSNILNVFLNKNGWYAEPYDSETIFFTR